MTSHYRNLTFTPAVQAAQAANGSRKAYAGSDTDEAPDTLTENEAAFIMARDSLYLGSTSETGWPYIQHRGGPAGFVKILSPTSIGFADFRGNRQYVSLGNIAHDDRVALFFMDYPNRTRLKLLGRMRAVDLGADPTLATALVDRDYRAKIERGFVIDVAAFDWNCPQHITPRYTITDIAPAISKLEARIAELEAELTAAKAVT